MADSDSDGKTFADLSQELVDEVVDHLKWSQEALRACSLTCYAFLPRSQFRLFDALVICDFTERDKESGISSRAKRIADLRTILENRPVLTTYIRSLHIYFIEQNADWLYSEVAFLEVVRRLENLDQLCLIRERPLGRDSSSFTDNHAFVTNFWLPFIGPRITYSVIIGMSGIPFEIIFNTHTPHLETLLLQLTSLTEYDAEIQYDGDIQIEHLIIRDVDKELEFLLSLETPNGTKCFNLGFLMPVTIRRP